MEPAEPPGAACPGLADFTQNPFVWPLGATHRATLAGLYVVLHTHALLGSLLVNMVTVEGAYGDASKTIFFYDLENIIEQTLGAPNQH